MGEAGRTRPWLPRPVPVPAEHGLSARARGWTCGARARQVVLRPQPLEEQPGIVVPGHVGPLWDTLGAVVSGWDLTCSWVISRAPGSRGPKPRPRGCRGLGLRGSRKARQPACPPRLAPGAPFTPESANVATWGPAWTQDQAFADRFLEAPAVWGKTSHPSNAPKKSMV